MTSKISLKDLERSLFRDSIQNGLIEIQIGAFLLMFVVAPLLSPTVGDFWSSVVFLPFWAIVYLVCRAVNKRVIQPRVGKIEYGTYRKGRLMKMNLFMLGFNLLALVLGFLSFFQYPHLSAWLITAWFSIILLIGFSLVGYMLELPRLYLYGLLIALGPLIGEFLYSHYGFSHHGLPAVFGFAAAALIVIGVVIVIRILYRYPLSDQERME
jgi:hypothetical protein